MKTISHKITAVFLSLLVLFTTTTYGMNTHICGDSVYSISLFGVADDCEMDLDNCQIANEDFSTLLEESCCNDINIVVENQTFYPANDIQFDENQTLLITPFLIHLKNLYQSFNDTEKRDVNYYSPRINIDIYILYEVFLI